MKKASLILIGIFLSNTSFAVFKPPKPVLVSDKVLVPQKLHEVKAFRVKTLPDMDISGNFKKIKGVEKNIVIPYYTITFPKKHILKKDEFEKKRGVNVQTNIIGISEQAYKDLTNWGYDDLYDKLIESGFNVVSKSTLVENDFYKKMKSKKQKSKKNYSFYFPEGLKSSGLLSAQLKSQKLIRAFNADVLGVKLSLDPMARQRDNSKFVTKKTKVGQAVYISYLEANLNSKLGVDCLASKCYGGNFASIKFLNPIYSEIPFARVEDETNTKANVAGHVITGFMRFKGIGAKTNYTFKYTLYADQEKYIEAAKDALSKTNQKLVVELNNLY